MDESLPDEALMLQYGRGNVRAFEILYERHKGPLYRYCARMARPAAVAEELFQDIWTNVVRARTQYQVRAKFTTWLYRLAHNRLVDHYRRSGAALPVTDGGEDGSLLDSVPDDAFREPDNELDRRRFARRLIELLNALPDVQREVFLLREEGGLSIEEIATATGVGVETTKSRLRYAIAKLREGLRTDSSSSHARSNDGYR